MSEEILIPKDSVEILNELKPGITIATERLLSSETVMASVKINGITYVEYEKTESLATQAVAESALKDLFFEQIKSTMFNDNDFQVWDKYNTNSWKLLGSLAMFKLIEDWLIYYMSNNKYKDAFEMFVSTKTESSKNFSQNNNIKADKNDCISKKEDSMLKSDKEKAVEKKKQQSVNKKNTVDISKKMNSTNLLADKIVTDDTNACSVLNLLVNIDKKKQQSVNKKNTVDTSNKMNSPNLLADKSLTDDTNACSVLNLLVKSIKFIDLQLNADKPPFKFSVILDNIEYKGDPAGSKKEAKQNVAKKVLMKRFGYLEV